MKKIFVLVLVLALMLCAPVCLADDNGRWYSVDDDTLLTVRLKANATTGYFWTCSMTKEGIIEMVSEEYIEDEHDEGMAGVGGQYVASFKAAVPSDGSALPDSPVSLVFTYARSSGEPLYTAILDLYVYNGNVICVENDLNEAEDGDTDRSGCELSEDRTILSAYFNGLAVEDCVWNWTIDDTDILDEITSSVFPGTEGLTSGMSASFFATNTPFVNEGESIKPGTTFLTITYGGDGEGEVPLLRYVYRVTVAEDGTLTLE